MNYFLPLAVYAVLGALHWNWSHTTVVPMYYALSLVLLVLTNLTARLPVLKKVELGLRFLALSSIRMFLFLATLLPVLLYKDTLGLSKIVIISTLFPFLLVLLWDAKNTLNGLKDR